MAQPVYRADTEPTSALFAGGANSTYPDGNVMASVERSQTNTRSRTQRWVQRTIVVVILLVAAIGVMSTINSPFIVETPGPVFNLATLITGPGINPNVKKEHFYLTTVNASSLSWWGFLRYKLHPVGVLQVSNSAAEPITQSQSNTLEYALLHSSQNNALIVASDHVFGHAPLTPNGATVLYVVPNSPAAKAGIKVGDRIVSLGGHTVKQATDVTAISSALSQSAAPVPVTVVRSTTTLHLQLNPRSPATPTIPWPGVGMDTSVSGHSPYKSSLTDVGGPSGGLMYALTYTSALTQGTLAGHWIVAGTGTITPSGVVGPISGISQKVKAALAAGATVFFAPDLDVYHAQQAAIGTKLKVIGVSNYTQALTWLCQHGGSSSACPASPLQPTRPPHASQPIPIIHPTQTSTPTPTTLPK